MDPSLPLLFIFGFLILSSVGQVTVTPPVTLNPTPSNAPVTVTPGSGTTNPPQPVTSPTPTAPTGSTPTTPTGSTSGGGGGRKWCVAKGGVTQSKVQAALDYACGTGKADCSAIQQTGSCYNPNTLQNHASYAFNNYFQKNPSAQTSCDFGGAATLTTTNPSSGSCVFPTSSSSPSSPTTATSPSTGGVGAGNPPGIMNGNGSGGGGVFPTTANGMGDSNSTTDNSAPSSSLRPRWIEFIIVAAVTGRIMNFGF